MQLVLDTQKDFRFRTKNSEWGTYKSLIIRENVIHQLDTNNSVQLIIYLDANAKIAQAIKSGPLNGKDIYSPDLNFFHFANSNELEQALVNPEPARLENLVNMILTRFSREMGVSSPDDRVLAIEQAVSTLHPDEISVKAMAEKVYLSESRVRSLFKNATGISLYRYILWNKIRFATNQIMTGDSVNDAALEAGFTDSSHFHKMMVKMFGKSPSEFMKNNGQRHFVKCDKKPLVFKTRFYN